jgi:hypothetical protein
VDYLGAVPATLSDSDLARLLPGSWLLVATNLPYWLSGQHLDPVLSYDLVSEQPLRLKDSVRFSTDAGEAKIVTGVDSARGGSFVRRGRGLMGLLASRWRVTGSNAETTVVAIQHDKTLAAPAGIDILVRQGASEPEVRSIVAGNAKHFGLSLEQFATLYWFGDVGRASA